MLCEASSGDTSTPILSTCLAKALCAGLRMLRHSSAFYFAGSKQESLPSQSIKKDASRAGTGVFLLLLVNLALFAADKYFRYAIELHLFPISF